MSDNSHVIHISATEQEYLAITILGRSIPQPTNIWDANWLDVSLVLRTAYNSGEFQRHIKATILPRELISFRNQLAALHQSLRGSATFSTLEGWLEMKCVGDGRGHIDIACQVRNEPGIGDTLNFQIHIDQTYLPAILSSLDDVLAVYPVIQAT